LTLKSVSVLQVDKDLREMLVQPNAPAPKRIGIRVWPKAIPQFNLGHLEVVQVRLQLVL
jgi:oxygen-dependent protoporphyrinogen oxidase